MTADLGGELPRFEILQHDAAAVGFDPVEDHVHDPRQQLVDVHRVAHRQRRAIHDLQVAAGAGEPGVRRAAGVWHQPFAAAGLAERGDDPRTVVDRAPLHRDDVDLACGVVDPVVDETSVEQQRAADLHLVAAGELVFGD